MMSFEKFREIVSSLKVFPDDSIVINGGEPTIHPHFYDMISFLQDFFPSRIVVYTNGINLIKTRLIPTKNLQFVIPVHGNEYIHDFITRTPNSFKKTIDSLHFLHNNKFTFSIKFILNADVVEKNINLFLILKENFLNPKEIILARLNSTKKSKQNGVHLPQKSILISKLRQEIRSLKEIYTLMLLDIPLCYTEIELNDLKVNYTHLHSKFFFSDYKNTLVNHNYYKKIKIGNECDTCNKKQYCELLSHTYLTLRHKSGWTIENE